jgi:hypothetical protein
MKNEMRASEQFEKWIDTLDKIEHETLDVYEREQKREFALAGIARAIEQTDFCLGF